MTQRPFGIEAKVYRLGKDYVFHVTGGVAHIGAVATAYQVEGEVKVELVTVPGHREDELAVEFATLACRKCNNTVTAIVGIHIHQATKKQIETAVLSAREAVEEVLSKIHDIV